MEKANFCVRLFSGSLASHTFLFSRDELYAFGIKIFLSICFLKANKFKGLNDYGNIGTDGRTSGAPQKVNLPFKCKILKFSCGENQSFVISEYLKIYACGNNNMGQLGIGKNESRTKTKFVKIPFFCNKYVDDVTSGSEHSLFKSGSKIFGCGYNGSFGNGREEHIPIPIIFPSNIVIKSFVAGGCFSMFISNEGFLYKAGFFTESIIGSEIDKISKKNPYLLDFSKNNRIIEHSCGLNHYICLTFLKKLFVCGSNEFGQLGIGKNQNENSKILTNLTFHEIKFFRNLNIKQISCGAKSCHILLNNGDLYAFGSNRCGQIGKETNSKSVFFPVKVKSNVVFVLSNFSSCFIVDNKKRFFGVGQNSYGELGMDGIEYRPNYNKWNNPIFIENEMLGVMVDFLSLNINNYLIVNIQKLRKGGKYVDCLINMQSFSN